QTARDRGRHVVERQAKVLREVTLCRLFVVGGFRVEVQLADGDVQGFRLTLSDHLQRHRRTRLRGDDHLDQRAIAGDRLTVELDADVARLDAGLFSRRAGGHRRDDRAVAILEAALVGGRLTHRPLLNRYADHAARDLADAQLRQQLADD